METVLVIGIILMVLVVLILQILLWRKQARPSVDLAPLLARTEAIERAQERTERGLREEVGRNREEAAHDSSDLRQEIQAALATFSSGIRDEISAMSSAQNTQLEMFGTQLGSIRDTLDQRLAAVAAENLGKLDQIRAELLTATQQMRTELSETLKGFNDSVVNSITGIAATRGHKTIAQQFICHAP